jgi:hypothetical protein
MWFYAFFPLIVSVCGTFLFRAATRRCAGTSSPADVNNEIKAPYYGVRHENEGLFRL